MITAWVYGWPIARRCSDGPSANGQLPGAHRCGVLYSGDAESPTHQSLLSSWRYGSAVPGLPAMPKDWVSAKMPAGVRLTPSAAAPTPADPTNAENPNTRPYRPAADRCQPSSTAVVDVADGALTVITWPGPGAAAAAAPCGEAISGTATATAVTRAATAGTASSDLLRRLLPVATSAPRSSSTPAGSVAAPGAGND